MAVTRRTAAASHAGADWAALLYLAHALLEFALGGIKLRGTYSGIPDMPPAGAKFARHHGCALLALALLGFLVWQRKLVHTETGAVVSLVLAAFHSACVLVMVHALNLKVVLIHAPFAVAFIIHTSTLGQAARRTLSE